MGIDHFFLKNLFLVLLGWVPLSFGDILGDEENHVRIYKKVAPSVVRIDILESKSPSAFGSGIVWDKNGHIVTNFHVVAKALSLNRQQWEFGGSREVMVSFFMDEVMHEAEYVGADPSNDIAVIKLKTPASKLVPIELGESWRLQVGQGAIVIGHPLDLNHTMNIGIVSQVGRQIEGIGEIKIRDMIQTDADINPGNSGGPLVNTSGKLIGMNTLIASINGSSSGLGFSVSVDRMKSIVSEIILYGNVKRTGGLGMQFASRPIKDRFRLKKGVVVESVHRGGSAETMGIKGIKSSFWGLIKDLGDVVTQIDDREVNSIDDIHHVLQSYQSGQEVNITYIHNGEEKTGKLRLIEVGGGVPGKSCRELLELPLRTETLGKRGRGVLPYPEAHLVYQDNGNAELMQFMDGFQKGKFINLLNERRARVSHAVLIRRERIWEYFGPRWRRFHSYGRIA